MSWPLSEHYSRLPGFARVSWRPGKSYLGRAREKLIMRSDKRLNLSPFQCRPVERWNGAFQCLPGAALPSQACYYLAAPIRRHVVLEAH